MVKDKKLYATLILCCVSVYLSLLIEKSFGIFAQEYIIKTHSDSTPWVHLNALGVVFTLAVNAAIPPLIRTFQAKRLLVYLLSFIGALLVYHLLQADIPSTFILLFGTFIIGGTVQTVCQIILNHILLERRRSMFQGIYNTLYNLTLAVGPFLGAFYIPAHTFELSLFFVISLSALILCFRLDKSPLNFQEKGLKKTSPLQKRFFTAFNFFKEHPFFFLLSLTTCLNMGTIIHLLMFWGKTYNLSMENSKLLPSVFSLGGMLLPIPLGYLSDKYGMLKLYGLTLGVMIGCYFLLSFDLHFGLFDLGALFLLGGGVTSSISYAFSYIGTAYQKEKLVQGTAAFAFMRLTLSIFSLYFAGEIIDQFNATTLNLFMCVLNIGLGYLMYRSYKKNSA